MKYLLFISIILFNLIPPIFAQQSGSGSTQYAGNVSNSLTGGSILIQEIYPYDDDAHHEYITLFMGVSYSGSLDIAGLGHSSASKTIDISASTGDIILVTDVIDAYSGAIVLPSISLTDAGEELQILGHSGHIIDTVVYEKGAPGNPLQYSVHQGNIRVFKDLTNLQVGSDNSGFISLGQGLGCSIILQNKKEVFAGNSINLTAAQNQRNINNGSASTYCERTGIPSSESTKCNPSSFIIEQEGLHEIAVAIYHNGEICTTKTIFNLPKEVEENVCPTTPKEDHSKNEFITRVQDSVSTGTVLTLQQETLQGKLKILGVLPNPEGADADKEGLIVKNTSDGDVDTAGLIVNSGKRSRTLSSKIIEAGETTYVYGELGLYNNATCIQLEQDSGIVLDAVCYPESKAEQRYVVSTGEKNNVQETYLVQEDKQEETVVEQKIHIKDEVEVIEPENTYEGLPTTGDKLANELSRSLYGQIFIEAVMPNPNGKDGEQEGLVLSGNNVLLQDTLILNTGKTRTTLAKGITLEDGTYQRIGDLGLYNSPRCIRIESQEGLVYDDLCYPQPKEGVWYNNDTGIRMTDISDTERMSALSLSFTDPNQVCIQHNKGELLCKENPLHKLQAALDKEKARRIKAESESSTKVASLKHDKELTQDVQDMYETFIYDIIQELKTQRPNVYDGSIKQKYEQWRAIKGIEGSTFSYGSQVFDSADRDVGYRLSTGSIPLEYIDINEFIQTLKTSTHQQIKTIAYNLQKNN